MIHVYGFVEELASLPAVAGLGDAPLERRRVGELELVVSRCPSPKAAVSRDEVLRHAQVGRGADEPQPCRPAGAAGPSVRRRGGAGGAVRARATDLAEALRRVRGCVEFGVRVVDPQEPA